MRFFKKLLLYLFVSHLLYIFICRWINPPITLTQIGSMLQGNGLKRDMISYDKMGSNIKLAVIAGEDQLFPDHNGFDMKSIKKAMAHNEKHPGRRRGASTISQQVAKNVFLWQGGGFIRKGLEVYFTFMIETFWSKERILQTYLNVAEMGKGIFGAQAAAKSYFKKDAINLTKVEASQIAACLPNPKKYTVKPLSKYVSARSNFIQRQMNAIQGDKDIKGIIN
ncbi:MAG: monofunctional biosynthetic peptidoglycan transglycosylase [Ferruginibacter sp.]